MARRRWYQFSLRTLLGLMVVACLVPGGYVAYQAYLAAKREAEIEAVFAWFDSLGYPSVAKAKPIRISFDFPESPKIETVTELGFLLQEDDRAFTPFTISLQSSALQRESQDGPFTPIIRTYESIDLSTKSSHDLSAIVERESTGYTFLNDVKLSQRARLFVLAWACSRQGYGNLSRSLFEASERIRGPSDNRNGIAKSFVDRLSDDFADVEMQRAIIAFADIRLTRSELLPMWHQIENRFSDTNSSDRVRKTVETLEAMILEDERYRDLRKDTESSTEPNSTSRAAELIFQLRDHNSLSESEQIWTNYSVFETPNRTTDSAAHRLLTFGDEAVPELIQALADCRFTRSVRSEPLTNNNPRIVTIGEAVRQILERMASRKFGSKTDELEEGTERLQTAARNWYHELQTKGERQCLLDGVERGDDNSVLQFERLLERYSADASAAALKGIQAAREESVRDSLIKLLVRTHGDETILFLLSELHSPEFSSRLRAAQTLQKMGRSEGLAAMLEEWNSTERIEKHHDLGCFLIETRNVEAIRAVRRRFSEQSVFGRTDSVAAARRLTRGQRLLNSPLAADVIALCLTALNDTDVRPNYGVGLDGKTLNNPRVCDLAGEALYWVDAERFPFDLGVSFDEREAARQKILAAEKAPVPPGGK